MDTFTGPPAVAAAPIVMPLNVTVTAALAATAPDCSVSTMLDAPLPPQAAVAPPLKAALGVTLGAKKPDGYTSVTVLGAASAPPADVVKLNVTGTPAWFTTRLELAILTEIEETTLPKYPDAVLADCIGS